VDTVSLRNDGEVAIITLDDGKANALALAEFAALNAALDEVERSHARACVVAGRPGVFSAGFNLKVMPGLPVDEKRAWLQALAQTSVRIWLFPVPVVAAVSGHAVAAGALLALACEVRLFAAGLFRFAVNEVPLGLYAPTFAIELVRAAAPAHQVPHIILHGAEISPPEALAIGIAEALHPPEGLLLAAAARARELSALAGPGYALTKQTLHGERVRHALIRFDDELPQLVHFFEQMLAQRRESL
jgi:enoyl-CoA hydratase